MRSDVPDAEALVLVDNLLVGDRTDAFFLGVMVEEILLTDDLFLGDELDGVAPGLVVC
jgi:hypothetical protein